MEQIQLGRNLSSEEQKNLYYAVAVGCLKTVCDMVPGPMHQKKKRVTAEVHDRLVQEIPRQLTPVKPHNIELLKTSIKASEKVLFDITKTPEQRLNVMLNLAGFCMGFLPVSDETWRKYNSLFDMWKTAQAYNDIKAGERIFYRIQSETQILVAQRGGIIL